MAEPTHDTPPFDRAVEDRPKDRLDSWKEIAAYLNRDVTTVQRWEKREGMPVHRHLHDSKGSVYASRAELDVWVRSRNLPSSEEIELAASSPIPGNGHATATNERREVQTPHPRTVRSWVVISAVFACLLLASVGWLAYKSWRGNAGPPPIQRALTRLTSDEGLQTGATWSPDGRYIAYASDRGGKYEIWVQQISGGDPIQITKGPAENWMPDWSPDGKYIAYRSEEGEGGIYITPALGGESQQRKVASFGYSPLWSPDSSRILLQQTGFLGKRRYVVGLDGSPPREVLGDQERNHTVMFSTWHPDGRRITSWVVDQATNLFSDDIPTLWTEPVDGGPAVETKFSPELQKQIKAVTAPGIPEFRTDFRFAWAPSGGAIYFERTFRGARNLWRITVDPVTLQATNIERLTTSPGLDADFAISRDGSKLAFTSEHQQIRGWEFPFDATAARLTGPGRPVTSPGIEAWSFNLSPDGEKLAVGGNRDGRAGTWDKSVPNGREEPIVPDDSYLRGDPVWSPDGKRAAYDRTPASSDNDQVKDQVVVWSSESRNESFVGPETPYFRNVYDWSRDGKSLLIVQYNRTSQPDIWQLPIDDSTSGESTARRIAFHPNYALYQPHMSPDTRWIVFEAVSYLSHSAESTLYTIASSVGPTGSWIRITDSKQWDDKPR